MSKIHTNKIARGMKLPKKVRMVCPFNCTLVEIKKYVLPAHF